MTSAELRANSLRHLADEYARTRRKSGKPISIAAAIRAIRMLMPDVDLSDREIADIVAEKSLQHGHVIDFDHT